MGPRFSRIIVYLPWFSFYLPISVHSFPHKMFYFNFDNKKITLPYKTMTLLTVFQKRLNIKHKKTKESLDKQLVLCIFQNFIHKKSQLNVEILP